MVSRAFCIHEVPGLNPQTEPFVEPVVNAPAEVNEIYRILSEAKSPASGQERNRLCPMPKSIRDTRRKDAQPAAKARLDGKEVAQLCRTPKSPFDQTLASSAEVHQSETGAFRDRCTGTKEQISKALFLLDLLCLAEG